MTLSHSNEQLNHRNVAEKCREKIESIGLPPAERADLIEVLSSKFAPDRYTPIIHYGRHVLGMSERAIHDMVQEVAFRCLEVGCKGKMLERLVETYPFLEDAVRSRVMRKYRLQLDDLPPWEDEQACILYDAPLSQDHRVARMVEVQRDIVMAMGAESHTPIHDQQQPSADPGFEGDHPDSEEADDAARDDGGNSEGDDDLVCGAHLRAFL